jgi:dolichyl-phosphate beta-glucosyltransferase
MTDKTIKYSIVVPAYQEAAVIKNSLALLAQTLKSNQNMWNITEVLVVTADSPDGTAKIAKNHAKLFKHFQLIEPGMKVGKGRDVRAGVLASRGDFIIFTDADMATPPKYISQAFGLLEKGTDIVIGIRPLAVVHKTFTRKARSVISNVLIQLLAVPGISDTQCGFKGFTATAAKRLFEPLETKAWGFDIEILARARSIGYKIEKIKIIDWYDPKIGKMGLAGESDLQANIKTLKELFGISLNIIKGKYK